MLRGVKRGWLNRGGVEREKEKVVKIEKVV